MTARKHCCREGVWAAEIGGGRARAAPARVVDGGAQQLAAGGRVK